MANLFINVSTEEKKRNFKSKCVDEGLKMRVVVEMAIDEFLKKGKKSCFVKNESTRRN